MMSETALMVLELAGIALLIAGLPLAFLYFKKRNGLISKAQLDHRIFDL